MAVRRKGPPRRRGRTALPTQYVFMATLFGFALISKSFHLLAIRTTATRETITSLPSLPLMPVSLVKDASPNRRRRRLPSFENGGIVFFLHIAKTGGVTIRNNFAALPNVRMERCRGDTKWRVLKPQIDQILTRNTTYTVDAAKALFIEFHGNVPGLISLHPLLEQWRELADRHQTSFFSFTLVREPVAFYASYFNFFWTDYCKVYCHRPVKAATQENLIATAVPNHQTLYLARDLHDKVFPVNASEYALAKALLRDFDWMGTTENMQTTTLPLLSYMLGHEWTSEMPAHNKLSTDPSSSSRGRLLSKRNLTAATTQKIQQLASFDVDLYETVQRDYSLSMWEDLPPAAK